jgi:hypothetical protein
VVAQPAVAALPARAGAEVETLRITSKLPGANGNDITVEIAEETSPAAPPAEGSGEGAAGQRRKKLCSDTA